MNPLQRLVEIEHDIAKTRRHIEWNRLKNNADDLPLDLAHLSELDEEKSTLIKKLTNKIEIADEILKMKGNGIYDDLMSRTYINTRIKELEKND